MKKTSETGGNAARITGEDVTDAGIVARALGLGTAFSVEVKTIEGGARELVVIPDDEAQPPQAA